MAAGLCDTFLTVSCLAMLWGVDSYGHVSKAYKFYYQSINLDFLLLKHRAEKIAPVTVTCCRKITVIMRGETH